MIEKAAKNLHNILNWSGILFDEGPGDINRGSYGPYIQSERLYLYKEMIEYLLRVILHVYNFISHFHNRLELHIHVIVLKKD